MINKLRNGWHTSCEYTTSTAQEFGNEIKDFKPNIFVGCQILAGGLLGASGGFEMHASDGASGQGTMQTGVANSARNMGWFVAIPFSKAFAKTSIGKDIAQTRANVVGAFLAAGTNVPQLLEGINSGGTLMESLANHNTIGAGSAVAAYTFMMIDQSVEAHRLKVLCTGLEAFQNGDMNDEERDMFVGYKERGNTGREFFFNWAPGLILVERGATFALTGARDLSEKIIEMSANGQLDLSSLSSSGCLTAAGMMFMFGAANELRKQNSIIRPKRAIDKVLDPDDYNGALDDQNASFKALSIPNIEDARTRNTQVLSSDEFKPVQTPENIVFAKPEAA